MRRVAMTDIWRVMKLRPVFCCVLTCREWSLLYGDDCFGFDRLTCALNLGTSMGRIAYMI